MVIRCEMGTLVRKVHNQSKGPLTALLHTDRGQLVVSREV